MLTEREMQVMGHHFGQLSDWFLTLFEKDPQSVSELAHNEILVRKLKIALREDPSRSIMDGLGPVL